MTHFIQSYTSTESQQGQQPCPQDGTLAEQYDKNDQYVEPADSHPYHVPDVAPADATGFCESDQMHLATSTPSTSLQPLIRQANQMNTPNPNIASGAAAMIFARQQAAMLYGRDYEKGQPGLSEVQLIAALQKQRSSNPLPPGHIIRTTQQFIPRETVLPQSDMSFRPTSEPGATSKNIHQQFENQYAFTDEAPPMYELQTMTWNDLPSLDLTLETCIDRARGLDFQPMAHVILGEKMREHMSKMSMVFSRLHDALAKRLEISMQALPYNPEAKARLEKHKRALYLKAERELRVASQLNLGRSEKGENPAQHQLNLLFNVIRGLDNRIRSVATKDIEVWKASCYLTAMRWQMDIHEAWIEQLSDGQELNEAVQDEGEEEEEVDQVNEAHKKEVPIRTHRRRDSDTSNMNDPYRRKPGRPPGAKNKSKSPTEIGVNNLQMADLNAQHLQIHNPAQLFSEDSTSIIGASPGLRTPQIRTYYPNLGQLISSTSSPFRTFGPTQQSLLSPWTNIGRSNLIPNPYLQHQYNLNPSTANADPFSEPYGYGQPTPILNHAVSLLSQDLQPSQISLPPLRPEYANLRSKQQNPSDDSNQSSSSFDPNTQL